MPMPSRKTPQRIARVLKLHNARLSAREISEQTGVAKSTIVRWLAEAGLNANGGNGKRATRNRIAPDGVEAVLAEVTEAASEMASTGMPPTDRAGAIAHLGRRLMQVAQLADVLGRPDAKMSNPAQFAAAVRLEKDLASQIVELAPQEALDPDKQIDNVSAAADVRAKVGRLIEAAKQKARCCNCGGNPFLPAERNDTQG